MPVLDQLVSAIRSSAIEVIDLTARLESATPVIQLPLPRVVTETDFCLTVSLVMAVPLLPMPCTPK